MTHIKKLMFVSLAAVVGLSSCLKADKMNFDPENTTGNILTMQWIEAGSGTTINSGLQYFAGGTLLYPAEHESDTATFTVQLNGPSPLGKPITLKVGSDDSKLLVNYDNDSINYEKMPDSLYSILNDSYTINAGERVATFKVVFYPSKINLTKNYMLAMTVTETGGVPLSDNYGHIFFHTIGNPIAGGYTWDFYRYNALTQDPAAFSAGASWEGEHTSFTPVNGTTVKTPTGYYVQPNYLISFVDNGGVLSDFSAVIDPSEVAGAFTDNGITIVQDPTITVENDNTKFTINYVVFNGSAYRNNTDVYTK